MNNQIKYILNVTGTGVLVILLLGIIFFWADRLCDNAILDHVKSNDFNIAISPCILTTSKNMNINTNTKDWYIPSSVSASISYDMIWTLGLFRDIDKEDTRFQDLSVMSVVTVDNLTHAVNKTLENSRHQKTYFDKNKGLFINCKFSKNFAGKGEWVKIINYYVGPEGISNEPTEQLGRFIDPLINEGNATPSKTVTVLYDKGLKRFFRITITNDEKTIVKSRELDSEIYNPIQMSFGYIAKLKHNVLFNKFEAAQEFIEADGNKNIIAGQFRIALPNKYSIVVNDNGRIDLLDIETFELKNAGNLPEYRKLQYSYFIQPVFFEDSYTGLIISTISSNLKYMDTYVFDANGTRLGGKTSWLKEEELPGGTASISCRYIIESLQPAGFNILSYLTANNYDGVKSQQAMFVRPNSAVATFAKVTNGNDPPFLIMMLFALVVMGPSVIIGIILGWRVSKRAKALGLSKLAVRLWTYGVIFTGVSGYFTFIFTKHAEMMITCKNCGQLRRVEQETCHNCKADWEMKHLKAADWRIVNS